MALKVTTHRPFVGRTQELGQVSEGIADVFAGQGRVFLIAGEPGIGKTRMADEVAALAGHRGIPVIWGRSWEAGGAPAYWPWLEVLAFLTRTLDDRSLEEAMGDGATQVAELVPEIARRLGAGAPGGAPPDEARFRFWRAVAGLVRRAAVPSGLVLVFEDLHAADRASLALLYFVAREVRSMRVLLLVTCRDVEARLDPEAGELISRIGREGVTLGLARLDREAVRDLLGQRAGTVAPSVAARIFESTQGNPLFVEEMSRLLGEEGPEAIAAGVVPSGVRDVIRQRLDRVVEDTRALLDLAAVAGDELNLSLLACASGRQRDALAATLAEATRVGVVSDRGGRPRFSHALVREVLYRELDVDERRALHARIGTALEALHANDAAPPLAELAHHALEGPPRDVGRAVDFAVAAGTRALELLAADEAVALLTRAGAAVDAAGNPPALRARVLLALGEARLRRGEVVPGRAACCEAAALARSIGDATLVAGAALTYGSVFVFGVVDPVLVEMLEEALAALVPGDSPLRARLLARLGAALQPSMVTEEPVRVAREAIAVARRLGDRRVLLETIHDALSALMDMVDPRERFPLNLEAEQLAVALGDRVRLLRTHARLVLDGLALGDLRAADARLGAFEALGAELRAPWHGWRASQFRTVRALMEGRFADAERQASASLELGRAAQDPQVEGAMVLHREGILRTMERHDEMVALDPHARRERASFHDGLAWQSLGSAMVFARIEDADKTRLHLDLIPPDLLPPVDNVFALFCVAEPVAVAGSAAVAEQTYRRLLPIADQYAMLGMTQVCWEGPVSRLLGLLAARLERWDVAISHFDDAMARVRSLGARPHAARLDYELARVMAERGLASDRARVRDLFASALSAAELLGMPGLIRLAGARLAAVPASGPAFSHPAPADGGGMPPFAMALEGEYWTISRADTTLRLKDSLGLQYLAKLVSAPGHEMHVLELAGGVATEPVEGRAVDHGDAGELLDSEARADYARRLADLREMLGEAESFSDAARAARAREEIEFLGAELSRAVGLGGRGRRAGAAAERARSAVQRRIKNALDRIAEAAPDLGAYLARNVKTGNFCVFRPDPG